MEFATTVTNVHTCTWPSWANPYKIKEDENEAEDEEKLRIANSPLPTTTHQDGWTPLHRHTMGDTNERPTCMDTR